MAKNTINQTSSKSNDFSQDNPASLWSAWWSAIASLRPAFRQSRIFFWFVLCVAGMTIRQDLLGVTSIVRALKLREACYHSLLRNFHSKGICLDT